MRKRQLCFSVRLGELFGFSFAATIQILCQGVKHAMGAWTQHSGGRQQTFAPTNENVIHLRMKRQHEGSPTSDQLCQLMLAVGAKQDRSAFAMLFGHLAPRIKSYFMRSGLTGAASEELVQETMLAVWRKASLFDPTRARVSTWVYTIARNQKIDALRRERRQVPSSNEIESVEYSEPPPSGEAMLLIGEWSERVNHALNKLSKEQARVVRLSFFTEKPHSEIARELGIPLGTVKSRIRAAIGQLRELLDNER